jgi:transposase
MIKKPMPLTDHDLRQMSDAWVSALTPAQKDALLVRALSELRKSRDRLNQTPKNSSKPPSSRAPWESTCPDDAAASVLTAPMTKPVAAPVPTNDDDTPQGGGSKTPGPGPKSGSGKPKAAGKQVGAPSRRRDRVSGAAHALVARPHPRILHRIV